MKLNHPLNSRSSIIVTVVVLLVVGVSFLALYPTGITVGEDNNLRLNTLLRKDRCIPLDEISIVQMPVGLFDSLKRTFGMSSKQISYGHYMNTRTGEKLFLYLTDDSPKICFIYKDKMYIVDSWME